MRNRILRVVGAALVGVSALAAAPATQPAADLTTPKGALRAFAIATRTGNRQSLRESFHAATPTEEKLADLTADAATAVVRLRDAAVAKFGDEGAKKFNGNIPDDSHLGRIDSASEQVERDAATVVVQGPDGKPQPMHLVKVDGKWKISVARGLASMRPEKVEAQLAALAMSTKILDEVAKEIAEGRHKSAESAESAVKSKVTHAYLMQARQPKGRQGR